ncbi:prolyl oligopeptidase family serine peptidase [bacterium]|nr:prolyl oligopeptidase family serine peptidase [bacterium]
MGSELRASSSLRMAVVCLAACHFALPTLSTAAPPAPRVYRERVGPHWLKNKTQFWYRNDNRSGTHEFIFVDAEKGTREPAFDHAAVARQIGGSATADKLPVESLKFGDDGASIQLIGAKQSWELNRASGEINAISGTDSATVGLTPSEFVRPSRNGGEETELTFANHLEREVTLFWIDPGGNRIGYGTLQPGGKREQHTFAGHSWLITEKDGQEPLAAFVAEHGAATAVVDEETPKPRERRRRDAESKATFVPSPNGQWEAFVREDNLWLRSAENKKESQLTTDGVAKNSYHRDAIRDRAIGMNYDKPDYPASLPEVFWSPDSRWLIALKTTVVPEPRVTLIQSSPDGQLQPKQESYPYIKPGGEVPQQEVHLFEADSGREFVVDQSSFTNQWDLGNFRWEEDSSRFTFLFNQRGHQLLRVISVSAEHEARSVGRDLGSAGASPYQALVKTLIEESSNTFIDYSQKTYLNFLEKRGEIIWMSERDGWNHLYLFDASTGALKRQLTKGEWVVRDVERVDEDAGVVWFWAMGREPGQDAYYRQLCRIDLGSPESAAATVASATGSPENGQLTVVPLTDGDGDHSIQWSPDNRFVIDTWSRVDRPPTHELRNATNGTLICKLEEADASEISDAGYRFPERFIAKGRDGKTDIFGIIYFPKNFDATKKYPVIENIYAGPHGAFVPKSFHARYRHQQEIADRGFVIVQIDGMGTNWRSKKFHDVAWKNLKDAGFPDRIAWMKAAAATRTWMDLARVGIYGGSAGGQNALRAVLDYADFYKAAAADCGCHDNRIDKIWWNEAWMGLPGDGSYVKSSNVEDAHKLGGALLLTVGELDKNVDPSSTYQVVGALQKAGKQFEFMPMVGAGHGSAESDFGRHLRADFFVRKLIEMR